MSFSLAVKQFGDGWAKMNQMPTIINVALRALDDTPREMAQIVATEMRKAIRTGSYAPNSEATIIIKGSAKPLVDKGTMRNSIVVTNTDAFSYYGGIDPDATNDAGVRIGDIAMAQNTGYAIPVTDELRQFMASYGIAVHATTKFFLVPPRPFLTTALQNAEPQIEKIQATLGKRLVSVFGVK